MQNSHDRMDVQILMNLATELRNFDQNRQSSLIQRWFESQGVKNPIDSKSVFTNSDRFIGKNSNANYSGPGLLVYQSNKSFSKAYIGNFVAGKRQGSGVRKVLNKLYVGEYKLDQKHGSAQIWDISSGNQQKIFDGNFKHGLMNGNCYFKNSTHEFNGQMENGVYNGRCTILYSNGDKYEGEMKQGNMDGYGTITYKNGDVYQGVLKNNQMTGLGKYVWAKNEVSNYNSGMRANNFVF